MKNQNDRMFKICRFNDENALSLNKKSQKHPLILTKNNK